MPLVIPLLRYGKKRGGGPDSEVVDMVARPVGREEGRYPSANNVNMLYENFVSKEFVFAHRCSLAVVAEMVH